MSASRRRATSFGLAILFFAVLIARAPAIWLEGRFFADEADYFAYAWNSGPFEALLAPHLGYWALWTNLATVLGAHALPLEFAPLPAVLFGTAALGTLVWAILRSGSPFRSVGARALALTLVLVVPPGYGRTNVTFAHFWLAATAAVLLVSETERRALGARVLLLLAGLGGAVAAFLTPVFALRALLERSRERAIQAALLGAGAVFQLLVYLTAGREHASRFVAPEPDVLSAALTNHTLVHPLAGREVMLSLGERWARELAQADGTRTATVAVACVLTLLLTAWLTGRRTRPAGQEADPETGNDTRKAGWLVLSALALAIPSLLGGTPCGDQPTKLCYLTSQFRYFATPNALWALAVLVQATDATGLRRQAFRVLTVVLLVAGVRAFWFQTPRVQLEGPSWRAEVEAWRADPTDPLAVWPERWPPLRLQPR